MMTVSKRWLVATVVGLGLMGCPKSGSMPVDSGVPIACGWTQWGQSASHQGNQTCASAQPLDRVLTTVQYDPFVEQEIQDQGGTLTIHYPVPLLAEKDVYMMFKSGEYVPCGTPDGVFPDGGTECGFGRWDRQIWTYKGFRWEGGTLSEKWTFWSDWQPVPVAVSVWEPSFQAALAGDFIYIPGKGGTVYRVSRRDGVQQARINPFGEQVDEHYFVSGGIAATPGGDIVFNVLKVDLDNPRNRDATGYLVKVKPDGTVLKATYQSLIPHAPGAQDACVTSFRAPANTRPYPPAPENGQPVLPPTAACGAQRPGVNVVPAVDSDGTVVTTSRSHFNESYAYVVAVTADLKPKWATSLRDVLNDGCGVTVPKDVDDDGYIVGSGNTTQKFLDHCRASAADGVDPATNLKPAGRVSDQSSASPVILPDHGVLYGASTFYNTFRGHTFKLSATGAVQATYDFGWDITPAVYAHDGTYSILNKDNHYYFYGGLGATPSPHYDLTRLNAGLVKEWTYVSAETNECTRAPDGTVSCQNGSHPDGFEWCINAPALDRDGAVFANNEDGWLYGLDKGGAFKSRQFLQRALGASYTPLSIDDEGRVYTLNKGMLHVVGH